MYKIPRHIPRSHWQSLVEHRQKFSGNRLADLFEQTPQRAAEFSAELPGLYVDYSKHFITEETMGLLIAMAQESNLSGAIEQLFRGGMINQNKNNYAAHTALRAPKDEPVWLGGEDISAPIHNELRRMDEFVATLHAGNIKGYTGRPIKTVINIGIGGSYAGPRLAVEALADFAVTDIKVRFAANIDANDLLAALQDSDPQTTLFIIASKSFATRETMSNAATAIAWMKTHGCLTPERYLLAVTANHEAARSMGLEEENIFHIWQWVGGRYSMWSATGLSAAIKIGMRHFRQLLAGAAAIDAHFRRQPLADNLPVILALIDIWYINFLQARDLAIFPYDHALNTLPEYLSQLIMESNGKQADNQGGRIAYNTAPIVWGGAGARAQHAYFQCLHQGTGFTPADFIVSLKPSTGGLNQHHEMIANCLAQSAALMRGHNHGSSDIYKVVPGNRPSTTLLLNELSPFALGSLLCLYEHRCFVQAHIWNINPFDQWGVELGKRLAKEIANSLAGGTDIDGCDPSTSRLISRYRDRLQDRQD